jgi:Holliday junction resolvasome RuvABC endonuclease subunit
VLALDLASRYGYAAEIRDGVEHGALDIGRKHHDRGQRLARFDAHMRRFLLPLFRPSIVVIEQPWVSGDDAQTHLLIALAGVAEMVAVRDGRDVERIRVPAIRTALTGSPDAGKDQVMGELRRWGFTPQDDNAADALAALAVYRGWHKCRADGPTAKAA